MNEFFSDTTFLNRIKQIRYGENRILEKMNKIKEDNTDLSIDVFICILDKFINPRASCIRYSAFMYMYSVDLWNNYIFSSKKNFDLLLSYENMSF